jgi:hypothetical protein
MKSLWIVGPTERRKIVRPGGRHQVFPNLPGKTAVFGGFIYHRLGRYVIARIEQHRLPTGHFRLRQNVKSVWLKAFTTCASETNWFNTSFEYLPSK